jgi:hypothetical protein
VRVAKSTALTPAADAAGVESSWSEAEMTSVRTDKINFLRRKFYSFNLIACLSNWRARSNRSRQLPCCSSSDEAVEIVAVLHFDKFDREAIRQKSDNATDAGANG